MVAVVMAMVAMVVEASVEVATAAEARGVAAKAADHRKWALLGSISTLASSRS